MGEAKRRKQKLGEAYGKMPPVLSLGSRQLEEHINKFFEAWAQQVEELALPENADPFKPMPDEDEKAQEELGEKLDALTTWLDDYLKPYRPQDREKLASAVLDVQYATLEESDGHSEEEIADFTMKWVMQCLSLYQMFKPYLSDSKAKVYAQPLHSFYNMTMEEFASEGEHPQEIQEAMRQLFESCLGEPVGQNT